MLVIILADEAGLHRQFSEEFRYGSLQVARSTACLQDSDLLGRQSGGALGKRVPRNVRKPA